MRTRRPAGVRSHLEIWLQVGRLCKYQGDEKHPSNRYLRGRGVRDPLSR